MKIKELGCEVAITWTSDKFKDKHPSSFSFGLETHINITSIMFAGPKFSLWQISCYRDASHKRNHIVPSESEQGNHGQDSCKENYGQKLWLVSWWTVNPPHL